MESLEFNKIAGAVLATGLLVLGLKNLSAEVFRSEAPAKPGFLIVAAEAPAAAADGKPAVVVPIAQLLTKADPAKGMDVAKACQACHSFEKGGANKVGPALWDVVQRPIGSVAGFAYSDGFKAMGNKPWDFEALNAWLMAPKEYIKGTKMGFAGVKNDQSRADLIAYLASLSDAPKPFPKP